MEADPDFFGPAALAKAFASSATRATAQRSIDSRTTTPSTASGIARAAISATSAAPRVSIPRDAIAKLGAESIKEGIDRDMGAKHAKWFVTSAKTTGWLRETELVPKTQGIITAIQQTGFAIGLAKRGKVPPPVPPHVAKDVNQSRALYDLVKSQGVDGALGIVQGEHALGRIEFDQESRSARSSRAEQEKAAG